MKSSKLSLPNFSLSIFAAVAAVVMLAGSAQAQLAAYDDAGLYQYNASANANWTNGANQGFGFMPWIIVTNGPNAHGTYVASGNSPAFVIATNVLGTNCVWGLYANGLTDQNETTAFRGFANPLGTNTFKIQWGSAGAGSTTTTNSGIIHGWSGFGLRYGNSNTNAAYIYPLDNNGFEDSTLQFYLYFHDGNTPSTIYYRDGTGIHSVPGTSFSNLGRNNITNAIEAEFTPSADGANYHLVLKDCVQNMVLFATTGPLISSGQGVQSAALFNYECTGDQVYNRMQIAASTNIPPTISNLNPADGSLYLSTATTLSFEVDSFNSTVSSSAVSVYLNGVLQNGFTYGGSPNALTASGNPALAANTFYTYTIVAQDANGNVVSNNYTFNTFDPNNLIIDAMDYNYTTGTTSGQFINPAGVALYGNLIGTNGIDYLDLTTTNLITQPTAGANGNENAYRIEYVPAPQLIPIATDATGDPVDHEGFDTYNSGTTDYQLAFTDQGEWDNYTRIFTATNYAIYARAASTAGAQFQLALLASPTATTTNQPRAVLGTVTVQNTGGSLVYSGQLAPLKDFFGNTVVMPLAGTQTVQQIATQVRSYNLSYLTFVPVPNAGTLDPYISIGSPAPNATGVLLNSSISFTLVNRQTTVLTNSLQMFLSMTTNNVTTTTNLTTKMLVTSNAAGVTVSWSPTANLLAGASNTVTVIFTNSASVPTTNSWNFNTGTSGGALGNGVWSGAGGSNDLFWADAVNWTGNTPGPGFNASFASLGATATLVTNNIVSTNVTILGLYYNTNNSGYHTTWIQDGVTLTVTNPSTSITAVMQVGGSTGGDNSFNQKVTNTISGANGTLLVMGNSQSSGAANQLNFQVRQNAVGVGVSIPNLTTLDMSGLGTMIATVGKFYVAQGGNGAAQTNVSGCVYLARTNIITCLRSSAGHFEVGDSSTGTNTLSGSALYLGITNALYVDTMRIGKNSATNNLMAFNPAFTNNATPAAYLRGTNGLASRVSTWTIGDADSEPRVANHVQAVVDFSGGKLDALVNNLILGRGETTANDTGNALGTLTLTAGTLDVLNLTNGIQRANNTATEAGVLNVLGTATLVSPNIILAQTGGGTASLVSGTLNVTNGTVRGNIIAGGGTSTVNLKAATLVVSNNVGTPAVPLSALNLAQATVHLSLNTNTVASLTNIVATSLAIAGGGASQIVIDSANGSGTYTLINYTGTDPGLGNLTLGSLPAGCSSTGLVDNGTGTISLAITVATGPGTFANKPGITGFNLNGANIVINGTNGQAGDAYYLLASTNVALPLGQWTTVATNVVSTNGASSNAFTYTGTNVVTAGGQQQFYILSNTNSNH